MASPPPLPSLIRSPWIWGCFVALLALRCLYFNTFLPAPENAELLTWAQQVAQAPYLGLQRFLQATDLTQVATQTLSKTHQLMALPATQPAAIFRVSGLFMLLPGLLLGAYSFWATQFFCSAWALWVAFLAGLWTVRLLHTYAARHERLSILLATFFAVAFSPLFLTYSTLPTSALFALGFLFSALCLAGVRWTSHAWLSPQKWAVGLHLVLALYAAPLWPALFIGIWGLSDLLKNGRHASTWRFWACIAMGYLPGLAFVLWRADSVADSLITTLHLSTLQLHPLALVSTLIASSGLFLFGGLSALQTKSLQDELSPAHTLPSSIWPWWLGVLALTASAFVLDQASFYLPLVLGIPLGIMGLWPRAIGRKYVGTLALLGTVIVSIFPLWIVHHAFPGELTLYQQAQDRQGILAWLQSKPLYNTTLFFSTPASSHLFLSAIPAHSVLPHAKAWTQAMQNKDTARFRETHYPHTPILLQKWLVVSRSEADYLKTLRQFWGLKLLTESGEWQVFELGPRS